MLKLSWLSKQIVGASLLVVIITILLTGVAAAQQDSNKPVLLVNQVASGGFPQVVMSVTATDSNGLPLVNLSGADFLIFENNIQVPQSQIQAESVLVRDMRLVLAFDLSTPAQSLEQMKTAAYGLLATMGPRDRVAVISFSDQVKVEYDFTNNLDELRYIIGSLQPQGSSTQLNEAALGAVTMLNNYGFGRKSVVLMADRADTGNTVTEQQVNAAARLAGVSLYPIGYGPGVQQGLLSQMAAQTGGWTEVVSNPVELPTKLQQISVLLRQGYQLSFQSGLQADGQEHDVSVGVSFQGVVSEPVERSFRAVPGPVSVTLVGMTDDMFVQGVVDLRVQTTARAPIASVEYFLNDDLLASVTRAPFNYSWDSSTTDLGAYVLAATATDIAGNSGGTEVVINVVPAVLVVDAVISPADITVGDTVEIVADVFPEEEAASVEFLLDGTRLGIKESPPFSFSFDSGNYNGGEHLIVARALGKSGQQGEAVLEVEFVKPHWLTALGWRLGYPGDLAEDWPGLAIQAGIIFTGILMIIAITLLTIMLIRRIVTALRRIKPKTTRLKIYNTGNIRSRYQLRGEDPTGFLDLQFAGANEVQLQPVHMRVATEPMRGVAEPIQPAPSAQPQMMSTTLSPPHRPASTALTASVPSSPREAQGAAAGGGGGKPGLPAVPDVGKAGAKVKGASKFGQTIADMLGTVGSLLPESIGGPLQNTAQQIRNAGTGASMAAAKPEQMARAAQSVQKKAGKVQASVPKGMAMPAAVSSGGAATAATPAPQQAATPAPMQPALATSAGSYAAAPLPAGLPQPVSPAKPAAQTLPKISGPLRGWVQTPEIAPGDLVNIDLIITPTQRNKTRDCAFKITSKPVEAEDVKPLVSEGQIHIKAMSIIRRVILPFILSAMLASIALVLILLIAYFITYVDVLSWPVMQRLVG